MKKSNKNKHNQPKQTPVLNQKAETTTFESLVFGLFVLWMVGSAITGTVNQYTHLPVWDVWDSAVGFFLKTTQGDWSVWWQQHNEHRIVIGKVFFWLDLKLFGGIGLSLFVVTYLCQALLAFLFVRLLMQVNTPKMWVKGEMALALFIFGCFFQFAQHENLTMWFQSGFVLSVLLPLVSFYCFNLFLNTARFGYYGISLLFAFLACINMANGLVVMPLLILGLLLAWRDCTLSWQKKLGIVITTLVCSVAISFCFFVGYKSSSSLISVLVEHFGWVLQYLIYYFGSPFYYLVQGFGVSPASATTVASCFGILFFLISLGLMGTFLCKRIIKKTLVIIPGPLELCLFLLLSFFWMSALATATGRFGPAKDALNQAFASRYVLYGVASWTCVLVWFSPLILKIFNRFFVSLFIVLLLLAASLIPFQRVAFNKPYDFLFYRNVAGLALELGVNDLQVIQSVYPAPSHILPIAQQASAHNVSTFGHYPWIDLSNQLGKQPADKQVAVKTDFPVCLFKLESLSGIEKENRFVRVHGSAMAPNKKSVPDLISFFNNHNQAIGFALTGLTHKGALSVQQTELQSGFMGYLDSRFVSQIGYAFAYQDKNPVCVYKFQ